MSCGRRALWNSMAPVQPVAPGKGQSAPSSNSNGSISIEIAAFEWSVFLGCVRSTFLSDFNERSSRN